MVLLEPPYPSARVSEPIDDVIAIFSPSFEIERSEKGPMGEPLPVAFSLRHVTP